MQNDECRMMNEGRPAISVPWPRLSGGGWTNTDEHGRNGERVWCFPGPSSFVIHFSSFIILHSSFIIGHSSFIIPHSSCLHLPLGNWYTEESLGAGDSGVDGPRPILRDFFGAGDAWVDGPRPILRDFFGSRHKGRRAILGGLFLRPKERKCQPVRVSIGLSGNGFCGS